MVLQEKRISWSNSKCLFRDRQSLSFAHLTIISDQPAIFEKALGVQYPGLLKVDTIFNLLKTKSFLGDYYLENRLAKEKDLWVECLYYNSVFSESSHSGYNVQ